jgi:hypothetical protein
MPPKSALELSFTFTIKSRGTPDEVILANMFSGNAGSVLVSNPYEFLIEDVSNNVFHYRSSKLININLINLWWIVKHREGKPKRYTFQAIFSLAYQTLMWKITSFLSRVGLRG